MRVLLIRPPPHNPRFAGLLAGHALPLETLAGGLHNHDVELLDMQFDSRSLESVMATTRPHVVGVGGTTADVPQIMKVAAEAKRTCPETSTVVGGHHATIAPDDFNLSYVDAVVRGMGETTFAELVDALEKGGDLRNIHGLGIPSPSGLKRTADRDLPSSLDALPEPRRDLSARYRHHYKAYGRRFALLNTAKGCPFRCRFCSIVNEMQRRYLTKSPSRVVGELGSISQSVIRFADGNTFGSRSRMKELHAAIAGSGIKKQYMVDVRSDTIVRNADLVAAWRDVGLRWAAVGMEAISARRLNELGKDSSVASHIRAIEILHDNDITIIGQFMVDPDFSEADFDALAEFVLEHRIQLPSFTILTPFPGTDLHQQRQREITRREYRDYDCYHALVRTRMGERRFYRSYLRLHEQVFGAKKLKRALDQMLRRASGRSPPLFFLLLAPLLLMWKRRAFEREYGLR